MVPFCCCCNEKMDSWQLILSIVGFLSAYGWAREGPIELNTKDLNQLSGLGGSVYSVLSKGEPKRTFQSHLREAKKRRAKRRTDENAYPDPETFLKLFELAKAVGVVNPQSRGAASRYRSYDNIDSYPENTRVRNPNTRRGVAWRRAQEDYAEDPRMDWRKPDDSWRMRARSNPEAASEEKDEYQSSWRNRQIRQIHSS